MDHDDIEKLEDKLFEVMQTSELWWTEEIETLFNIVRMCVAYHVLEEKSLSERELSAYLDYQKEKLLAILADEKRRPKQKDFGDKRILK
jgi:hypothetical protein